MMRRNLYKSVFATVFILSCFLLHAQERYLEPVFTGVDVQTDVVYGNNVSILTGTPAASDLLMDVYKPAGDTLSNRPAFIILHTGTFGPPIFNGQVTGSRTDSVVVNVCKRLASLGYVAVAATYRLGWISTSPDEDIRVGSLLQAAYRGIQDTRTCIRYLRKSAAEDSNPYGIDPTKIGVWGIGTGGYLSLGAATLDDPEEWMLDKFLDDQLNPYADTALLGNPYATNQATISLPNHVGYSSDFNLCINMGGAMGDISWLDGKENEPAFVGFHASTDIFAPFGTSDVVEPTLGLLVIPTASGARVVIDSANTLGNNDAFNNIPGDLDPLGERMIALKERDIQTNLPPTIMKAGTENFYPFILSGIQGGPWDWWNYDQLTQVVAGVNAAFGTNYNADTLHLDGLLTNPIMSAENGNLYLDTVFMVTVPRAYYAFGLDSVSTSIPQLNKVDVGLNISPNPSPEIVRIQTNIDYPMRTVRVIDLSGRTVAQYDRVNNNYFEFYHQDLPRGMYVMEVTFDEGRITERLVFD